MTLVRRGGCVARIGTAGCLGSVPPHGDHLGGRPDLRRGNHGPFHRHAGAALRQWGWAGLVGVLVVAFGAWLWFAPLTTDTQVKLTAVATAAAAFAAAGSTVAAFASLGSARASNEVARRALRAVALHNRPTGWYRSLCKYDSPAHLGSIVLPGEETLTGFAEDEVRVWIELRSLSGVKAARFTYVTADGQQPPLPVTPGESTKLPGAVPIATQPGKFTGITPVNVTRWTLTCRDRETSTLWRATGVTEDGNLFHDDLVDGVQFEMVEE